jgi:hypothetical protein
MTRYQFQSHILRINQFKIFSYLSKINSDIHWQNYMAMKYEEFPDLVLEFIQNQSSDLQRNYISFFSEIRNFSIIGVTLGKRRQGKTCLLSTLALDHYLAGRYIAVYNYSDKCPDWMNLHKYNPDKPYYDVPNNAFILHSEIHLDIDSKNWNSKTTRLWSYWCSTSGHRKQSVFADSQLASNFSLDMMKFADVKLFKKMNKSNDDVDRAQYLKKFSLFYPEKKSETLADVDGRIFYFKTKVPDFYTTELSEAFK